MPALAAALGEHAFHHMALVWRCRTRLRIRLKLVRPSATDETPLIAAGGIFSSAGMTRPQAEVKKPRSNAQGRARPSKNYGPAHRPAALDHLAPPTGSTQSARWFQNASVRQAVKPLAQARSIVGSTVKIVSDCRDYKPHHPQAATRAREQPITISAGSTNPAIVPRIGTRPVQRRKALSRHFKPARLERARGNLEHRQPVPQRHQPVEFLVEARGKENIASVQQQIETVQASAAAACAEIQVRWRGHKG